MVLKVLCLPFAISIMNPRSPHLTMTSLSFVVKTFVKDWDNVMALCGDNTNVNK